jgi:hypothetical protein
MTLVVAISRGDDYALMTSDSSSFSVGQYGEAEDSWAAVPDVVEPHKVLQLTPLVLVATIGDDAIGWDFKDRLLEQVNSADGFDECSEQARAVVEELGRADDDLAGSVYERGGRLWRRGSLTDEHAFSFFLTGFRRQGGTSMVYGKAATVEAVEEVDGQRSAISRPIGIDEADITPHFNAEDPSLAGAFGQAFAVHHYLGEKHEDRVTRDVNCALLVRGPLVPDEPPVLLSLVLDRTDVDTAKAIYETLASREQPVNI